MCPTASAQSYGLANRPSVGAFLDGVMPATPPALTSTWTPVVAFPNLHFDNALGMTPMPGTNKLVVWEREGRIFRFNNNSRYLHTDSITLTATAADTAGNVSRVEFWDGNVKLGQDTTSTTVSVTVMPLKLDFAGFTSNGAPMLHTQIPAGRNYTISYTEILWHDAWTIP